MKEITNHPDIFGGQRDYEVLFLLKGSTPLPAHTSSGGGAEEVAATSISIHWQLSVQPKGQRHA